MPWINHLPPVCWSTFGILVWNDSGYVNLTQWWYFFIIFEYILHISTPHIMIFCFPLPYFPLSTSALFLLSTLVLTLYIDVVLSLSTIMFCLTEAIKNDALLHNRLHATTATRCTLLLDAVSAWSKFAWEVNALVWLQPHCLSRFYNGGIPHQTSSSFRFLWDIPHFWS